MSALSPMLLLSGIFQDEGATIYSAQLGPSGLLAQARVQDLGYVPYYLLMHLWLLPTDDLVWARLSSLLGYGAAVYLSVRAAQVWLASPRWALLAGALTAVNPLLVGQASNARPYALSAAATALAFGGLARLERGLPGGPARFLTGTISAVLLHEFAVLGSLAALLVVGLARRWPLRQLARLAVAASVLLLLLAALTSQQRGQLAFLGPLGLHDAVALLLAPIGLTPFLGLPQLLLVALLGLLAVRGLFDVRLLAPGAWLIVPSVLLLLGSLITPVYLVRYVTASTPALGLFVASALCLLWRPRDDDRAGSTYRGRALLGSALVALLLLVQVLYVLRGFVRPPDFQTAAAASACARSATLALPTHMARTTLRTELPVGVALWPGGSQPYLERFGLDTSATAFSQAHDTVAVCDYIHSPQDSAFERRLSQRGWHLVRSQDFDEWFVHSYARTAP